jgi:NADPH-dependent 2,4-dienoyl-CoA reductase/sulfur reductase-like enzyme
MTVEKNRPMPGGPPAGMPSPSRNFGSGRGRLFEDEPGPPELSSFAAENQTVPQRKYSFETVPDPIPADKFAENFTADVIVVGGGMAGMSAALSAREKGASVILIEKTGTFQSRGGDNAYIGTRLQKSLASKLIKMKLSSTW